MISATFQYFVAYQRSTVIPDRFIGAWYGLVFDHALIAENTALSSFKQRPAVPLANGLPAINDPQNMRGHHKLGAAQESTGGIHNNTELANTKLAN